MLHEVASSELDLGHVLAPLRGLIPHCEGGPQTQDRDPTFRYKMLGQLAALGRRTGVAQVMGMSFSGFPAWWLWRTIYLAKLPRLGNQVRVALDWTLDLVFPRELVQFLTAGSGSPVRHEAVF